MAARLTVHMPHYVAIVEDAGPDKAVGIWFPDLPGCFSAGDDVDDALRNAHEALALYAQAEAQEGRALPDPRPLSLPTYLQVIFPFSFQNIFLVSVLSFYP